MEYMLFPDNVIKVAGVYHARYQDHENNWRIACDARGLPIRCASEDLAASVAACRHRRVHTDWSAL